MRVAQLLFTAFICMLAAGVAYGQSLDTDALADAEDNGYFISLLEDQLSSESRTIRLSGVDGLLSSRATVERITISDPEGVWLQIDNATLDWNRRALITGRVVINELSAERIRIPRGPVPEEGLPEAEASGGFSIPELPVSVQLEKLEAERIEIGEALFGIEAALKTTARIELGDQQLDAALEMQRLDGAGGALTVTAKVEGDPVGVAIDLDFQEPQGGVVATALGLDDQPPMEVVLEVAGPVSDLTGFLDLKVDGQDLLDGSLTVAQYANGLAADLSLAGRLQPLVPPTLRPFFEGESTVDVTARQLANGGVALDRLAVRTGGLRLNGALSTAADGFPQALELNGTLGFDDGTRLALPSGNGETTVADGQLRITYGRDESWTGEIALNALQSGDLRIAEIAIDMGGAAENLDVAEARRLTGKIDGRATGFQSPDAALDAALGEAITLGVDFDWRAGNPLQLNMAQIDGANSQIGLAGAIDGTNFDGTATLKIPDMQVLGPVVGRELAGALDVSLDGAVDPVTGVFDLGVDGLAADLGLGIPAVAALLTGETRLAGRLRRSTDGIFADRISLQNTQLQMTADGVYSVEATDFDFDASLADMALIAPQGQGAVTLTGRAEGRDGSLGLDVAARMEAGRLLDRQVRGLELTVTAQGQGATDLTGELGASGTLGDAAINLSGLFQLEGSVQSLQELDLSLGQTGVTGTVKRGADGLIAGNLNIASPDISEPAALALLKAGGAVDAKALLYRSANRQMLSLDARINDLDVAGTTLSTATADLTIADLFGAVPLIDGAVQARDAVVASYAVTALDLAAATEGEAMRIDASAALGNGADIALDGLVSQLGGGDLAVDLNGLDLSYAGEDVTLRAPARVEVRGQTVSLTPLSMAIAGGALTAEGSVGETLDLSVDIQSVPLNVANAVVPQAGLGGVVSGSANITGPPTAPQGVFTLQALGLTAAQATELGLPPADIEADGQLNGNRADITAALRLGNDAAATLSGRIPFSPDAEGLDLKVALEKLALSMLDKLAGNQGLSGSVTGDVTLTGALTRPEGQLNLRATDVSAAALRNSGVGTLALDLNGTVADQLAQVDGLVLLSQGGQLSVSGVVPLDPDAATLNLDLALGAFPLAAVDQLAGGRGLSGTLSATATAAGRLTDPQVVFDVAGRTLSAQALREAGIAGLDLAAAGRFAGNIVTLGSANVTGPSGLRIDAGGTVPLSGPGLDIRLDGAIPLSVASVALARSQSQLFGTLTVNGSASGALDDPNLSGSFSIADGAFVNAPANVRLNDIFVNATVSGTRLEIASATAVSAQGGTLSVSGGVDIDTAAGLPMNLDVALNEVFYTDGQVFTTVASGNLSIDGPVLGNGIISGQIALDRAEVSLRGGFGINAGVLLDVEHRNPPRDVILTLDRARIDELRADAAGTSGSSSLGLDVTIAVPNQLFIRGRGVDAELGGRIQITGTTNDVRPVGSIELIRGRLSLLGQRIDFDEGEVTLVGDLDPRIRLVAETEASDGTVITVTVSGLASDPTIGLASVPELPEDEVLAQLIYGRNVSELSAFQIAQLAAAVATLSGGGDGAVGGFRSAIGLADLDITTGEDGDVGVRAGAYLSDNIYLDVEADSVGDTEATVNIDFSRYFTGKISVDNRGESSVGVFFQKDY